MRPDKERIFSIGYTVKITGMVTLSKDEEYFDEKLDENQWHEQAMSRIFEVRMESELERALAVLTKTYGYGFEWGIDIELKSGC